VREIIENLLRKPEPAKKFCSVVKPLGPGRYQVKDAQGRLITVDADKPWKIGAGVRVSQGRIVAGAAQVKQPKVYEV